MAFRASCIALLLASLPSMGCGTVVNLCKLPPEEGGKSPFGGVRHDVYCIKKPTDGEAGCTTHPESDGQLPLMAVCAADLPFSFVGDVLTWPYTAAYTCINQPVPAPPVTHAPIPVVTQATAEGQPQTAPSKTMSEPRKLP